MLANVLYTFHHQSQRFLELIRLDRATLLRLAFLWESDPNFAYKMLWPLAVDQASNITTNDMTGQTHSMLLNNFYLHGIIIVTWSRAIYTETYTHTHIRTHRHTNTHRRTFSGHRQRITRWMFSIIFYCQNITESSKRNNPEYRVSSVHKHRQVI